jgi:hypothetical protein
MNLLADTVTHRLVDRETHHLVETVTHHLVDIVTHRLATTLFRDPLADRPHPLRPLPPMTNTNLTVNTINIHPTENHLHPHLPVQAHRLQIIDLDLRVRTVVDAFHSLIALRLIILILLWKKKLG